MARFTFDKRYRGSFGFETFEFANACTNSAMLPGQESGESGIHCADCGAWVIYFERNGRSFVCDWDAARFDDETDPIRCECFGKVE